MPIHTHHLRVPGRHRALAPHAAVAFFAILSSAIQAADTSPQLLSRFTRQVQPLILNKCAAGACHGGPSAHSPHFQRGDVSGRLNRGITLANIESLTNAIGAHGGLPSFLATISRRHPTTSTTSTLQLVPLTPQERTTLEQWLVAASGKAAATELTDGKKTATTPDASATNSAANSAANANPSAAQLPNRFRAMLEAAANPPPLPPPQEPKGIILGTDRDG